MVNDQNMLNMEAFKSDLKKRESISSRQWKFVSRRDGHYGDCIFVEINDISAEPLQQDIFSLLNCKTCLHLRWLAPRLNKIHPRK